MDTRTKIAALANEQPMLFAKGASESDLARIEKFSGFSLPETFKWFISNYGSGIPGSFLLYGIGIPEIFGGGDECITDLTQEFTDNGWTSAEKGLVVAIDGRGNPVVLIETGAIIIEDHDVGDVRIIATDFEDLLNHAFNENWNII